jgi:hypothetical protein
MFWPYILCKLVCPLLSGHLIIAAELRGVQLMWSLKCLAEVRVCLSKPGASSLLFGTGAGVGVALAGGAPAVDRPDAA